MLFNFDLEYLALFPVCTAVDSGSYTPNLFLRGADVKICSTFNVYVYFSIKERGAEVSRKIRPSLILWEPFKVTVQRHLVQKLRRTPLRLRLRFRFYIVQGLANAQWNNWESIANCEVNFFWSSSFFTFKKPRWTLFTKTVLPQDM